MTSFNVAGLLHEPPGTSRDARLRDHYTALGPDVELAGPIDADLRMQRTNRGVLVRGEVRAPLRRSCTRCTDPFVVDVTVTIGEEFVPSVHPLTGAAVAEPDPDEQVLRIDDHHEIDLGPVLHDELALTEPMRTLCRPDCPGLCPECGERLDESHAEHAEGEIDPRLAGLAAFLDRGDGTGDGGERSG
jgi:uncharacterized protein